MRPFHDWHRGVLLVVVCTASVLLAREAGAQCTTLNPPCTNTIPYISITPSGGAVTQSPLDLSIHWADDFDLDATSRVVKLNGVVVTGDFSYQAQGLEAYSEGSVNLVAGTNTVTAEICDQTALCGEVSATFTYTPPPVPQTYSTPSVSFAPYHPGIRTVSPFEGVAAYSTPSYVSRDVPRAATLVYAASQARARVFLQLDAIDNSINTPEKVSIRVKDAAGAWVTSEAFYAAKKGGRHRLAATWEAPALATGAYVYHVQLKTYWSGGTVRDTVVPVRVLVLNEAASPFGAGWTLAGYQPHLSRR